MALFQWSDRFDTGIDEIDRQHRQLMALFNELDEACASGGERRALLGLLDDLVDHARDHSSTEEALMSALDLDSAEYQYHQAEHQAFLDKVLAAQATAWADPSAPGDHLLGALLHEFSEHMLDTDQRMGQLLRDMGATTPTKQGVDAPSDLLIHALRNSEQRAARMEQALRTAKQRLESVVQEYTQGLEETHQLLQQRGRSQGGAFNDSQQAPPQPTLTQSDEMADIGQFLAGIAHEISNPLGYISSNLTSLGGYVKDLFLLLDAYVELEATLPPECKQRHALDRLKGQINLSFLRDDMVSLVRESLEGTTRANQVLQDLRNFSHIDHQEHAPFDLEAGLDTTLNLVRNALKDKVEVIKDYAGLEPVPRIGTEINQVFLNLLMNAAQAIDRQGMIWVRTGRADANRVWVEVEDSGCGISPAVLARIFDPFFTTKPSSQGTGLGLCISNNIVKKYGGEIEVHSEAGGGSRFRVWLPAGSGSMMPTPASGMAPPGAL